ncbi:unnamed protein product [Allacma fusca]|uniref:b(0,+)-type amino acid transporter 1 n=1 Tax=Allacma fusca TaxID=39272 RepID=A0A8J2KWB9_9HEXA|nr:unnamed protein product [Allacma fusca]
MENRGFEFKTDVQGIGTLSVDPENRKRSNGGKQTASMAEDGSVGLKRQVGLLGSIALIVGSMIGSGIFVSPGGLLAKTGSVGLSLCVWAACGLLSIFGSLVYVELGTVVPNSGGEYTYLSKAFGPIPGFLYAWTSISLLKPCETATICLAFAKYAVDPFVDVNAVPGAVKLIGIATIFFITFINIASVKVATRVQIFFTIAKLLAIAVIIVGGIYSMAKGKTQYLQTGFEGSVWSFGSIAAAFYSGLWAYDGWNQLNLIVEEVKNPYRNVPTAIFIGLPLVTFCYILTNVAFLTLLSPQEIINSPSVGNLYGDRLLGPASFIMPLSVAFSTFGAANGILFTSSRLCFVASREGHSVDFMSFIDAKRNTPSLALIYNAIVGSILAISLDIENLIGFFGFSAWIFYGATVAAVIRFRYTLPEAPRPFKVPLFVPIVVLIMAVFLVVAPVVQEPQIEYVYAGSFILFGLVLYVPFVHYKLVIPGMRSITKFLQILFQALPPESSIETNYENNITYTNLTDGGKGK